MGLGKSYGCCVWAKVFIYLLALPLWFVGCNSQGDENNNKREDQHFREVTDDWRFENFVEITKAQDFRRYIDSAFAQINAPGDKDYMRYYSILASNYYYSGQYILANYYNDSVAFYLQKQPPDTAITRALANVALAKGDNFLKMEAYVDAYKSYFKARNLLKNTLSSCGMSDYNYRIAMVLYRQGSYHEAREYFGTCFELNNACLYEFDKVYRQQELLSNIALCFFQMGQNDSSMIYYNKCSDFLKAYKNRFEDPLYYDKAIGVLYGNMAKILRRHEQYDEAEELLKKSIQLNLRPGCDMKDAQAAMLELIGMYRSTKRFDLMKKTLDQLKGTYDSIPNEKSLREWKRQSWRYYQSQGDYEQAFAYLLESSADRDSAEARKRKFNEADIRQQLLILEHQTENELLKKANKEGETRIMGVGVFAIMLLFIIGLIYFNYYRSKKNIKELTALHLQVSEQKHRLEIALGELERQNNDKDRIMRLVAHDLRNPVSAVSSLVQMMLLDIGEEDNPQKEFLLLIKTSCFNILALIEELLEVTDHKVTTEFKREEADINTLLSNCADLLRFRANEKAQELMLYPLTKSVTLFIDKEKIWRVVSNLIVNAIKFSSEGSTIEVKAELNETHVVISIKDYGIGIPVVLKDKVFDSFTAAKRPGTSGEKAFGLGLSIAKQFVEGHNGSIWFESEEGKGTTFYISLPLH